MIFIGYDLRSILGHNCRFLQGPETDTHDLAKLKNAMSEGRDETVVVKNYRKDGTTFWNRVQLSPIRDSTNKVVLIVCLQSQVYRDPSSSSSSSSRKKQSNHGNGSGSGSTTGSSDGVSGMGSGSENNNDSDRDQHRRPNDKNNNNNDDDGTGKKNLYSPSPYSDPILSYSNETKRSNYPNVDLCITPGDDDEENESQNESSDGDDDDDNDDDNDGDDEADEEN